MDLKTVTKNLQGETDYRIDQRFDELMRRNPRYKNLDGDNQKLILDLIKKYKNKIQEHNYPSSLTIRDDMYHLYQDRNKLGLTRIDLNQIRDLLESFKR